MIPADAISNGGNAAASSEAKAEASSSSSMPACPVYYVDANALAKAYAVAADMDCMACASSSHTKTPKAYASENAFANALAQVPSGGYVPKTNCYDNTPQSRLNTLEYCPQGYQLLNDNAKAFASVEAHAQSTAGRRLKKCGEHEHLEDGKCVMDDPEGCDTPDNWC